MNNQTNTSQGTNAEHLLANSLLHHPQTFKALLESQNIPNAKPLEPEIVGGNKRKTDVQISFAGGEPPFRFNVKSFTAGYNHLERRALDKFCERNQIKKKDFEFLKGLWLRKAAEGGDLVKYEEREKVKKIFASVEPAISALVGNDYPQFFALFSIKDDTWKIYDMKKVIDIVRGKSEIGFTVRSANIEVGRYVVIQRKGSAKESKKDITDINHKANDVQMKMRVKAFYNEQKPIASYEL